MVARLIRLDTSSYPESSPGSDTKTGKEQRRRVRLRLAQERQQHIWKTIVARWLERKGVYVPGLDEDRNWAQIRLTACVAPNSVDHPPQSSQAVCIWPAALCFSYGLEQPNSLDGKVLVRGPESPLSLIGSSEDAKGLEWFQTATHSGFQDPLKLAQIWFQNKAKRDEEVEARRKERKAKEQEEAARLEAGSPADGGDYPPSPLHLRNGELQAVSGVYPTPPDGMPNQGHSGQPTTDGTITGGDSAESPRHFGEAGSDNTLQLDSAGQPNFHPNAGPDPDSSTNGVDGGHDNDDDLFGDMDDEIFNGPAVTDADFSFFDDETMDSTGFDDRVHGEDSTTNEETATQALVHAVKNIASPTDAQWKGSHTAGVSPEQAATSPLVDTSTSVEVGAASTVGQPESKSPALTKIGEYATVLNLHQESGSSPPLSPLLIKQKLLPVAVSTINTRSPQCEKRNTAPDLSSEFRPVAFNPQLGLSDAKYESGGRFGVNTLNGVVEQPADTITEGKPDLTTTDKPNVVNISLPPKVRRPRPLPLNLSRTFKNYAKHEETDSDADTDSSMWSEEDSFDDDTSDGPIETFPEAILARKRKRDLHDEGMHSITDSLEEVMSSESDTEDDGAEGAVSQDGLSRLITCFEPDRADWSLIGIPPPSCPSTQVLVVNRSPQQEAPASASVSMATTPHNATDADLEGNAFDLSSQDIINIAQILADQSVS
ncbi:mediator of RNA polymerase II transcription subunit 13, partial [Cryomyces antarcticus]